MAVMALTDGGFWATRCSQHCQVRQEMDANTFSETSAQFHLLRCCRMWPLRPAQPLEASADIVRVVLVWYEEFEIYYIWDDVEMSLRWVWNGLIEMFVYEYGVVGVIYLNLNFELGTIVVSCTSQITAGSLEPKIGRWPDYLYLGRCFNPHCTAVTW